MSRLIKIYTVCPPMFKFSMTKLSQNIIFKFCRRKFCRLLFGALMVNTYIVNGSDLIRLPKLFLQCTEFLAIAE